MTPPLWPTGVIVWLICVLPWGGLLLLLWLDDRKAAVTEPAPLTGWLTIPTGPDTVHIIPNGPVAEPPVDPERTHRTEEDCPCGPTVTPVPRGDGSIGWMVTHRDLKAIATCSTPGCEREAGSNGYGKCCITCVEGELHGVHLAWCRRRNGDPEPPR